MYATGNHSLQTLKTAAIEMGLRTKKGEPLAISQINKILKKPFYCGMMDINQNFYITANMVMNLAARAREIFESSEVDEKRELLNLVFQNLKLDGKKMLTEVREPFHTMIGYREDPTNWRWRESNSIPIL